MLAAMISRPRASVVMCASFFSQSGLLSIGGERRLTALDAPGSGCAVIRERRFSEQSNILHRSQRCISRSAAGDVGSRSMQGVPSLAASHHRKFACERVAQGATQGGSFRAPALPRPKGVGE
jgi:hypothetical protein